MRNDEFNSVEIKNEIPLTSNEFGKTPKESFSFKSENKIDIKDEVNPTKVYDEVSNGRDNHINGQTKHVDTQNKEVLKESSLSSSTSTSSATTASSTATTSVSVATAASVIAVASVSVVAGITTLANQNASCRLLDFSIYADKIEYALVIENAEANDFSLYVESNTYANSKKLELGENRGEFTGLSENATYSFVVKEEKAGGKTLLNQSFTTKTSVEPGPEPEPIPVDPTKFNGVTFSRYADFEMQTFELTLDYEDPDNKMSEFEIYLYDKDMEEEIGSDGSGTDTGSSGQGYVNYVTLPLEKTKEAQTVSVNSREQEAEYLVRLDDRLYIEISYYEDGNKVVAAQFDDYRFNQPSEFYGFNYMTDENENPVISARNIFQYQLYYTDDEHNFKSAVLRLYAEKHGSLVPIQAEIPIEIVEYDVQYIDFAKYLDSDELSALCSDENSIKMELIATVNEDGETKEVIWWEKENAHFSMMQRFEILTFEWASLTIDEDNCLTALMKLMDDYSYLENCVITFENTYGASREFKYQYNVYLTYDQNVGIQDVSFTIDVSQPIVNVADTPSIEVIKEDLASGCNIYFEYVDWSQESHQEYVGYYVEFN